MQTNAETSTPTNAELTREYHEIVEARNGDIADRRAALDYMRNSTAIYHHEMVDYSYTPRFFNRESYKTFEHITTTTHRILCKVIQRYLDDPEYRKMFDFDERLVDLILLPRGYDALLPFARFDIFLDEEAQSARFCEFNGDGSSGMNENREITNATVAGASYREFARRHHCALCELHESWVREFLSIYSTYEHKAENPHVAICDFLENAVIDEFKVYARCFEEQGVDCSIYDLRDLRFDGNGLYGNDGRRIDAVWRRCVTNDIIDNWSDAQQLIEAVGAEKVALIGSFAGHIVHDKRIFEVLLREETHAFLEADEISFLKQIVPPTLPLDGAYVDLAQVKKDKDKWLIKPIDKYGATDVFAGVFYTAEEWATIIDRYANGASGYPFILQEYVTPYKTLTLPADSFIDTQSDKEIARIPVSYNNLSGLYCYNGGFAGVFSRLGPLPTISKSMKGLTTATVWVED